MEAQRRPLAGLPRSVRRRPLLAGVVVACSLAGCAGRAVDALPPGGDEEAGAGGAGQRPAGASALPPSAMPPSSNARNPGLLGISEETCDDNPLLAMCRSSAPAPRAASAPPAPPAAPRPAPGSEAATVAQVETLLSERCGLCHGGEPSVDRCGTCAGMYYVENLRRLIQAGEVTPCSWQGSLLYRRIKDGSMPPPGSNASGLSSREQGLVGKLVDGLCSTLSDSGPEDTERAEIESWL